MPENEAEIQKIEAELKGTTFKVYWHIFRLGHPIGVRELQRSLNLSSPSVALHHLEKLRRLGLLNKDEHGRYSPKEDVKVGILRLFLKIGKLTLPRYLFYAVFFTSTLVLYLAQILMMGLTPDFIALVVCFSASLSSWYEGIKIWREKMFY
jgi:DNA-binding transcriptional ArsR family regulator